MSALTPGYYVTKHVRKHGADYWGITAVSAKLRQYGAGTVVTRPWVHGSTVVVMVVDDGGRYCRTGTRGYRVRVAAVWEAMP